MQITTTKKTPFARAAAAPILVGLSVKKSLRVVPFLLLSSVALVAACGSDSTPSSSSSGTSGAGSSGTSGTTVEEDAAAPATANVVTVKSNVFEPATLTVKVGDTVTWKWAGGSHDVVSGAKCASDGDWSSSLTSKIGTTFTHTFDKAGSFEYFCTPHCVSAKMIGTITVE
jgi:plastocyanin